MIDSSKQVTGSWRHLFWSAFCIKKVHRGKMTMVLTAVGHHVKKKRGMYFNHISTAGLITREYILLQVVKISVFDFSF